MTQRLISYLTKLPRKDVILQNNFANIMIYLSSTLIAGFIFASNCSVSVRPMYRVMQDIGGPYIFVITLLLSIGYQNLLVLSQLREPKVR